MHNFDHCMYYPTQRWDVYYACELISLPVSLQWQIRLSLLTALTPLLMANSVHKLQMLQSPIWHSWFRFINNKTCMLRPVPFRRLKVKVKASHTRYRALGPRADPGVQAVSPQVTISHPPGSRLPLLSARPAVISPATEHHRPLAVTKLYGDRGT